MDAREYFSRAYRLDESITLLTEQARRAELMATSLGSPDFEEHYNPNRAQEAPFVRLLEKVDDYERQTIEALEKLVSLKKEYRDVIAKVENPNERLVLGFRYLNGYTWERISQEMNADSRTVRRWHENALEHFPVPEEKSPKMSVNA